jgi:hypothetical protein
MQIDRIASELVGHLVSRMVRRAVCLSIFAICIVIALYHFTIAVTFFLDSQFGAIDARLLVGGFYALAGAIALAVFWLLSNGNGTKRAELASPNQLQLVMLVEAIMLGYSLARKGLRRH